MKKINTRAFVCLGNHVQLPRALEIGARHSRLVLLRDTCIGSRRSMAPSVRLVLLVTAICAIETTSGLWLDPPDAYSDNDGLGLAKRTGGDFSKLWGKRSPGDFSAIWQKRIGGDFSKLWNKRKAGDFSKLWGKRGVDESNGDNGRIQDDKNFYVVFPVEN